MKKWKCKVCDYIAEGDAPPDPCPVCGVPASEFFLIDESVNSFDVKDFLKSLHLHPVSSHFANGLLPVSFFFLLLFLWTDENSFEKTSFYLYTVAALALPITFGSGLLDWYLRYDLVKARIFSEKIILSLIVVPLSLPALFLRFSSPDLCLQLSTGSLVYSGIIFLQTCIITRLGYLGGKLIFN